MSRGFWTLRYTLINVTYFVAFCTIHALAAVFLLDRGFTNTEVGILLAVSNITSNKLLIISGVAFFIKILILVFATNMAMMYVSQSFQLFAYAVFIPAAAYYVSMNMAELDQVKGQAFVTSAITIGGVFSNLISGVVLDNSGIKPMLITGTVVAAVGVVIAIIALGERREKI